MKKKIVLLTCALIMSHVLVIGQANVSLSNLSNATAINTSLKPRTANAFDIGKPDSAWRNLYLKGAIFINGNRFVDNRTVGDNNFVGSFSGTNNTTGTRNNGFGNGALAFNTKGNDNTAIGYASMFNNVDGASNTTLGAYSLHTISSGYSNVAVGEGALYSTTEGHNLVAIGDSALYNQARTTGGEFPFLAYRNTAIGSKTLYKNTFGYANTATGFNALYSNTQGTGNTANGDQSLLFNTTGGDNTALGGSSLRANTTGSSNTAVGGSSLGVNTTGAYNTAVGSGALYKNNTGSYNTAIGVGALNGNTTLSKNTAVGYFAGNTTASSASTYLGHGARSMQTGVDNSTAIGFEARVTASNQVRIGNTAVTSIGGQVGWSTLSDGRFKKNIKEDVPGLDFITQLRPVTYTLDEDKIEAALNGDNSKRDANESAVANNAKSERAKIIHTGFIAQEVEKMAKQLNYDFSGVDAPKNNNDLYGLRYSEFVVPLVKAVQELSAENDQLRSRLDKVEALLAANASLLNPKNVSLSAAAAKLDQNYPNPYNNSTAIPYFVPGNVNSASMNFYNSTGSLIKSVKLSTGKGTVTIGSNELASGIYSYSLMTDGKVADTKQMARVK